MTIRAVADTHAILWYLYDDARLSSHAGAVMDAADDAGDQIAISAMTLVEIVYLVEKGRVDALAFQRVLLALDRDDATLVEIPVDRSIAVMARQLNRTEVPELPDRIVAATALHLGVPAITRDRKISTSMISTIW